MPILELVVFAATACCLQNFFGGVDEEWFRLVHVSIEAAAAPAIAALQLLQQAALQVMLAGSCSLVSHVCIDAGILCSAAAPLAAPCCVDSIPAEQGPLLAAAAVVQRPACCCNTMLSAPLPLPC
jgi:hypothetical protein